MGKYSQKFIETVLDPKLVYNGVDVFYPRYSGFATSHGCYVKIFIVVDPFLSVVHMARFRSYGAPMLVWLSEATCAVLQGEVLKTLAAPELELVQSFMSDNPFEEKFSIDGAVEDMDLIRQALLVPIERCRRFVSPWERLPLAERIEAIKVVFDSEVSPVLAEDGGALHFRSLSQDGEISISYSGTCATCQFSTGDTLKWITSLVRNRLHRSLRIKVYEYI